MKYLFKEKTPEQGQRIWLVHFGDMAQECLQPAVWDETQQHFPWLIYPEFAGHAKPSTITHWANLNL